MSFCTNCGNQLNKETKFCPSCGKAVETAVVSAEKPVAEVAVLPAEVIVAEPVAKRRAPAKTKALGFVGMGIAIIGLYCALIACGETFMYAAMLLDTVYNAGAGEAVFVMALIFTIMFLPICIVGLCLSSASKKTGFTIKAATLGEVFGVIGCVLICLLLFVGFISLAI